jgi:hypothetical protein
MVPVLFGRFFWVSGSFRGQGRKVNIWLGLQPDGAVRDDNAIGTGSIPKMAVLAFLDPSGSVEPVSGIVTPTGTSTKS